VAGALVGGCGSGALTVTPPRPPGAVSAACAALVNYLPAKLDGHGSRVVSPRSPLTHAWGHPPIVLRCGVPRPAGFNPDSAYTADVNGVLWFQHVGAHVVTWTAVRTSANVELAVPTSYDAQGGFLVELARAIKTAVP
jgi:hypothetical protein